MRRRSYKRRDGTAWFGVLGATTVLVIAVIGFIAYRANSGLPWQSRYEVTVRVPDADRLINAADVRVGGVLVGEVLSVTAEPGAAAAAPYASLKLALNHSVAPLPVDTTAQVRPASVLGLTYVDLVLGHSARTVPAGGTLSLRQAQRSSDLTDLFDVFSHGAARGFQRAVAGLAYGLAGRGTAINSTLSSTDALLPALREVATALATPLTRLSGFLNAYEATIAALAPVSPALAGLVSNGATTVGALARVSDALGTTIDAAAPAEASATTAFVQIRPALDGLATLAVGLRPAAGLLPGTLGEINSTLGAGVKPLRRLPGFSGYLGTALGALQGLAADPNTNDSLRKLLDLVTPTNEVLSTFVPAQVNCDVLGLWGDNFSSTFTGQGDGQGPGLPNLVITGAGALGEALQNARPSPNLAINPLPNETQQECESGNEPWTAHQQLNNPPGLQSRVTRLTTPPPGVSELARTAGLLQPIPGAQ
jgi:virulence factor Mce-like protein